jgi:hypothetical protein
MLSARKKQPSGDDHPTTAVARQLTKIAQEFLSIETLENRYSFGLDYHEVPVWRIRNALYAAYLAGKESK